MCVKIRNFLIFPHIKIKKNFLHSKTFFTKKDFCDFFSLQRKISAKNVSLQRNFFVI